MKGVESLEKLVVVGNTEGNRRALTIHIARSTKGLVVHQSLPYRKGRAGLKPMEADRSLQKESFGP